MATAPDGPRTRRGFGRRRRPATSRRVRGALRSLDGRLWPRVAARDPSSRRPARLRRCVRALRGRLARQLVRARPPRRRDAHRAPARGTAEGSEVPHRHVFRHRPGDAHRHLRGPPRLRAAPAGADAARFPPGRPRVRDPAEQLAVDHPVAHLVVPEDRGRRQRARCGGDSFPAPRGLRSRPRARARSPPTAHAREPGPCERCGRRGSRHRRARKLRSGRSRDHPPCRSNGCRRHVRRRGNPYLPGPFGSSTSRRTEQRTSISTAPAAAASSASI